MQRGKILFFVFLILIFLINQRMYWSLCNMVTYLIYLPVTDIEKIYTMLVIIVNLTCIFGYSINTIGMILSEIAKEHKQSK